MIRTFIALAVFIFTISPGLCADDASSLTSRFSSGQFLVKADEEGQLYIKCIDTCSAPVEISSDVGQNNLGIFRLSDGNDLLFTTWVGGSSYRLIVYLIDGSDTRVVLNEYGISAPDLNALGSLNHITIRLTQFASERDRRNVVRIWDWDYKAKRFQRHPAARVARKHRQRKLTT